MPLDLATTPAFRVYAIACVALVLKMLALAWYGALLRGRAHAYLNDEDTRAFGGRLVSEEAPEVQRALRALRNDTENIPAFLVLGLVFVLQGATALAAWIHFGIFVAGRTCFSVAYVRALQPLRTTSYVVSTLAVIALLVRIVVIAL
jgi:microsomal prostaglandin-E synthase 1